MPNFSINIFGCVAKYKDFDGAVSWIDQARSELDRRTFEQLLNSVFDELLVREFVKEAEELNRRLPHSDQVTGLDEMIARQISAIDERRKRAELEIEKQKVAEASISQAKERIRLKELDEQEKKQIERSRREELERKHREQRQAEETARQEAERYRKAVIAKATSRMLECFDSDFLNAETVFESEFQEVLGQKWFDEQVISFVQSWFRNRQTGERKDLIRVPDNEQALAIASGRINTLVVARAGSGKTATIVNRAYFLAEHCHVNPTDILLLAFNRKAAIEIKERLEKLSKCVWPHVMTFHALAYAIEHPEEDLVFNKDHDETLNEVVQAVVDDKIRDACYQPLIKELMLARWTEDWEKIESGGYSKSSKADFLDYRRLLPRETLNGDYVKSYGEKRIANFLFEHSIPYFYEKPTNWKGRNYRPDFTILHGNGGVVIEYFGILGDPEYDAEKESKIAYWDFRTNWELIEVSPKDITRADFDDWMRFALHERGIECTRLSEDEIWDKAKDRAIGNFTRTIGSFIGRARKLSLDVDALTRVIAKHRSSSDVEFKFLNLAVVFYADYLDRLNSTGKEDFDGLLMRAVRRIVSAETHFNRKSGQGDLKELEFVFIDEYQDFSNLFFQVIDGIRQVNKKANLFCVGDDWQAINGFAGSDLHYFREFYKLFDKTRTVSLTTNYRSGRSIVDLGNWLMAKPGEPVAVANRSESGCVSFADISLFSSSVKENDAKLHSHDAGLIRLVKNELRSDRGESNSDVPVVVLSRKKTLPSRSEFREIYKFFDREELTQLNVSTVHGYKGLQSGCVVVADAFEGCYPLIHPDWMFTQVFGDTLQKVIEEERRIFYVALTRAKDDLVILTQAENTCMFLKGLKIEPIVDWEKLPKLTGEKHETILIVRNGTNKFPAPTFLIKSRLSAAGFKYCKRESVTWEKTFVSDSFDAEGYLVSQAQIWGLGPDGVVANDVIIDVCDGHETVINRFVVQNGKLIKSCEFSKPNV